MSHLLQQRTSSPYIVCSTLRPLRLFKNDIIARRWIAPKHHQLCAIGLQTRSHLARLIYRAVRRELVSLRGWCRDQVGRNGWSLGP